MLRTALRGFWATCVLVLIGTGSAFAADDIVLYATDAMNLHGNWALAADASAAGGRLLASKDGGWSTTTAPLAAPADYFEVTFSAPAARPYHLWVRLRAQKNSKNNDSLWAQFSDAVDAGYASVFGIGTTSGLLLNLENCSGCGVSGWGWQDKAWWLTQPNPLQFATSGSHTLRIQTREDGVQIDQIVLSPATYLAAAPGGVKNDTTIVPKPAVSTPFLGTPAAVPGTIEAENFDNGGEGVAYHDATSGNAGGQYRTTDVDLEAASEGGYDVGWIAAGEWLNYSVTVATAGSYLLEARVANASTGGTFHLEVAGANISGPLTIPDTGGWQNWTTVSTNVTLAAGTQILRVVFDTNGASAVGNLNWLRLSASSGGSTPYTGAPVAVPGTVTAVNFDNGGEGVAYHDTTAGNSGGAYRSSDVDVEPSSPSGYDVGWTAAGEWLNYTVSAAAAGDYTITFHVASPTGTGRLHATIGTASTAVVTVPNTGGWQNWTTVSVAGTFAAGTQIMRVVIDAEGLNLSAIDVAAVAPPPPPPPPPPGEGTTYTVNAGGDLQAVLDAAQPGDVILLQAGATFVGNFVLPAKSAGATNYITIRSSAADASLPAADTRMSPSYSPQLPKLQSPNSSPALATAPYAHHYQLMFLELLANYQGYGDILDLGDGSSAQNTLAMVPHDLVIDRIYVHGDVTYGQKRGIGLNSASTTIKNSYVAEIKAVGQDSQAICGWNGPGPYTITNNYLEAAGENVLFGGSDPAIPNLVPSDIAFRGNYLAKQPAWMTQNWSVKNIFELKNAQRVVVDGNVMEYNWLAGQPGYSVLFTPRNQGGTAPWSVVQQVEFTNNVVRHVSSAINILGQDDANPSQLTNAITIRNNLFEDISSAKYGGAGRFVLIAGGSNITVDHNTVFEDGSSTVYADSTAAQQFVFTNNIVPDNAWAVMGSGASPGNGTIGAYFPASQWLSSVFAGSNPGSYPAGNYYPASMSAIGFVDVTAGNYRLATSSLYHNAATDGTDVGCNIDAVNAAAGTRY